MKKLLISILFIPVLFLTGCSKPNLADVNIFSKDSKSSVEAGGYFTGSDYKGNYVYSAAMNLAWNDLSDNVIKEEIKLNTDDKLAQETTFKLNNSSFTKNDLDEESYYIKSGYGQKTVEEINRESKIKFPEKIFPDLDLKLREQDILAYAYFLKEVEYLSPFSEKNEALRFKGKEVKSFYASNEKQRDNIEILNYENDDNFILKIGLKNKNDELILAKGYDMNSPKAVIDKINHPRSVIQPMTEDDVFIAPSLNLDMHRDYNEMIEKNFANNGFTDYYISKMFEDIKFKMDHKGARAESQAVIEMTFGLSRYPSEPIKYKELILDKPYWVIMKRAESENPYFILGINNTELMELDK